MFKYIIIFLILIFSQILVVEAQNDKTETQQILRSVQSKIIILKPEIDKNKEDSFLLDSTERSVNTLIRIIKNKEVSLDYVASIKRNEFLLDKYQINKSTPLIKIVEADFNAKASFAEENEDTPTKKIIVKFKTQNNTGYYVRFILTGDRGSKDPSESTNTTNEAEETMIAGEYLIWVRKDKSESKGKKIKIGKNAHPDNEGNMREPVTLEEPS